MIFCPASKPLPLWQAVAFLLPGALLVGVALLHFGFWCRGWLLGLPARGLLLSRWSPANPLRIGQLLGFLGLLVLGMAVATFFNIIWVILSLWLFLLPLVPPFGWLTAATGLGHRKRASTFS